MMKFYLATVPRKQSKETESLQGVKIKVVVHLVGRRQKDIVKNTEARDVGEEDRL